MLLDLASLRHQRQGHVRNRDLNDLDSILKALAISRAEPT